MEIDETTVLGDRGFIQINGDESKEFLQNISMYQGFVL